MYSIAFLTICLAASVSFEAEEPVVRAGLLITVGTLCPHDNQHVRSFAMEIEALLCTGVIDLSEVNNRLAQDRRGTLLKYK